MGAGAAQHLQWWVRLIEGCRLVWEQRLVEGAPTWGGRRALQRAGVHAMWIATMHACSCGILRL